MPNNRMNKRFYHCRPAAHRRPEKRRMCSDLIQLRWVDSQGSRHEETVVLELYCNSGASLLMGLAMAQGTRVTLCAGGGEFRAMVRHCGLAPNGYLVSVDFEQQPGSYVPEHLLDLSRLSYGVEP